MAPPSSVDTTLRKPPQQTHDAPLFATDEFKY